MDHIKLINEKIKMECIHSLLGDEGCGAHSIFVGTTRDNFDGKKVLSLEYEAYDNMAIKEMQKICTELRERWPNLKHIVMYHRLGTVPVCEGSVVIATSAPHRAEALESVSFAIDQLKARVPIWKKEIYEGDPKGVWKENKECPWPNKSKRVAHTFDFSSCKVERTQNISEKFVQIGVDDGELKRRIKCFVKRKREEINATNIMDFIKPRNSELSDTFPANDMKPSCARTESIVIKQEHSKCHLKVRRADNRSGPQMRPNYLLELNKLMTANGGTARPLLSMRTSKHLLNDRLKTIETYMGLSSCENIFSRVKNIENRLLLLESVSPEYKYLFAHFGQKDTGQTVNKQLRKTYRALELDEEIKNLRATPVVQSPCAQFED